MAEVSSYDFYDILEDCTVPTQTIDEDYTVGNHNKSNKVNKLSANSMLQNFFKAFEKVNFSQMDSTDSLASFASQSSMNSFASTHSFGSVSSEKDLLSLKAFFHAVQVLTIDDLDTTNTLSKNNSGINTEENNCSSSIQDKLPMIVQAFVKAFDEFMHNPSNDESIPFPKLC